MDDSALLPGLGNAGRMSPVIGSGPAVHIMHYPPWDKDYVRSDHDPEGVEYALGGTIDAEQPTHWKVIAGGTIMSVWATAELTLWISLL